MKRAKLNKQKILTVAMVVVGIMVLIGVVYGFGDKLWNSLVRRAQSPADTLISGDGLAAIGADSLSGKNTSTRVEDLAALQNKQAQAKQAAADSTKAKVKKTAGHGWTVSEADSMYTVYEHNSGTKAEEPGQGYFIRITKSKRQLTLYKDGAPVKIYPVGVGKNSVDKVRKEDNATPEGNFKIQSINNSTDWKFDGVRAYGPWFLRLDTTSGAFSGKSWTGIGIHGTSNEKSIGGFVSHGCVRMFNKDITELKNTIEDQVKTSEVKVVVLP